LDGNQKVERVTMSHGLPEVMKEDEEKNFQNVVTGDES
jgi:hypothetical protein